MVSIAPCERCSDRALNLGRGLSQKGPFLRYIPCSEEQYCKQDKAKALGSTEGFKDTSCRIEVDLGKLPDPLRCELEAQVLINSPCSIKACL
jgi:hypothetical protein